MQETTKACISPKLTVDVIEQSSEHNQQFNVSEYSKIDENPLRPDLIELSDELEDGEIREPLIYENISDNSLDGYHCTGDKKRKRKKRHHKKNQSHTSRKELNHCNDSENKIKEGRRHKQRGRKSCKEPDGNLSLMERISKFNSSVSHRLPISDTKHYDREKNFSNHHDQLLRDDVTVLFSQNHESNLSPSHERNMPLVINLCSSSSATKEKSSIAHSGVQTLSSSEKIRTPWSSGSSSKISKSKRKKKKIMADTRGVGRDLNLFNEVKDHSEEEYIFKRRSHISTYPRADGNAENTKWGGKSSNCTSVHNSKMLDSEGISDAPRNLDVHLDKLLNPLLSEEYEFHAKPKIVIDYEHRHSSVKCNNNTLDVFIKCDSDKKVSAKRNSVLEYENDKQSGDHSSQNVDRTTRNVDHDSQNIDHESNIIPSDNDGSTCDNDIHILRQMALNTINETEMKKRKSDMMLEFSECNAESDEDLKDTSFKRRKSENENQLLITSDTINDRIKDCREENGSIKKLNNLVDMVMGHSQSPVSADKYTLPMRYVNNDKTNKKSNLKSKKNLGSLFIAERRHTNLRQIQITESTYPVSRNDNYDRVVENIDGVSENNTDIISGDNVRVHDTTPSKIHSDVNGFDSTKSQRTMIKCSTNSIVSVGLQYGEDTNVASSKVSEHGTAMFEESDNIGLRQSDAESVNCIEKLNVENITSDALFKSDYWCCDIVDDKIKDTVKIGENDTERQNINHGCTSDIESNNYLIEEIYNKDAVKEICFHNIITVRMDENDTELNCTSDVELNKDTIEEMCNKDTTEDMYDNNISVRMDENDTECNINDRCTSDVEWNKGIVEDMYENDTVTVKNDTERNIHDFCTSEVQSNKDTIEGIYNNDTTEEIYNKYTIEGICNKDTVEDMYDNNTITLKMDENDTEWNINDCCTSNVESNKDTDKEVCNKDTIEEIYIKDTTEEIYDKDKTEGICNKDIVKDMYDNNTITVKMDENDTEWNINDCCTSNIESNKDTDKEVCNKDTIKEIYNKDTIKEICNKETIKEICNKDTVEGMYVNDTVIVKYDTERNINDCCTSDVQSNNDTIEEIYNKDTIKRIRNKNIVEGMYDNDTITVKMDENDTEWNINDCCVSNVETKDTDKELCNKDIVEEICDNTITVKIDENDIDLDINDCCTRDVELNKDTIEKEICNRDTIEEEICNRDTVEEEIRNGDTIEEEIHNRNTIEEEICNRDTIEKGICKRDTIEEEICNRDTVEEEICNRDTVEEEICNRSTVEEEIWNRGTIEEMVEHNYNDMLKHGTYSDFLVEELLSELRENKISNEETCILLQAQHDVSKKILVSNKACFTNSVRNNASDIDCTISENDTSDTDGENNKFTFDRDNMGKISVNDCKNNLDNLSQYSHNNDLCNSTLKTDNVFKDEASHKIDNNPIHNDLYIENLVPMNTENETPVNEISNKPESDVFKCPENTSVPVTEISNNEKYFGIKSDKLICKNQNIFSNHFRAMKKSDRFKSTENWPIVNPSEAIQNVRTGILTKPVIDTNLSKPKNAKVVDSVLTVSKYSLRRVPVSKSSGILESNTSNRYHFSNRFKVHNIPFKNQRNNVLSNFRLRYKVRGSPDTRHQFRNRQHYSKTNPISGRKSMYASKHHSVSSKNLSAVFKNLADTGNRSLISKESQNNMDLQFNKECTRSNHRNSNEGTTVPDVYSSETDNMTSACSNRSLSPNPSTIVPDIPIAKVKVEPGIHIKEEQLSDEETTNNRHFNLHAVKSEANETDESSVNCDGDVRDGDEVVGDQSDEDSESDDENMSPYDRIRMKRGENRIDKSNILKQVESCLLDIRSKLVRNVDEVLDHLTNLNMDITKHRLAENKLKILKNMIITLKKEKYVLDCDITRKMNDIQYHYDIIKTRNKHCSELEKMCLDVGSSLHKDKYEVPSDKKGILSSKLIDLHATIDATALLRRE